jgi:hypothetical protein
VEKLPDAFIPTKMLVLVDRDGPFSWFNSFGAKSASTHVTAGLKAYV